MIHDPLISQCYITKAHSGHAASLLLVWPSLWKIKLAAIAIKSGHVPPWVQRNMIIKWPSGNNKVTKCWWQGGATTITRAHISFVGHFEFGQQQEHISTSCHTSTLALLTTTHILNFLRLHFSFNTPNNKLIPRCVLGWSNNIQKHWIIGSMARPSQNKRERWDIGVQGLPWNKNKAATTAAVTYVAVECIKFPQSEHVTSQGFFHLELSSPVTLKKIHRVRSHSD